MEEIRDKIIETGDRGSWKNIWWNMPGTLRVGTNNKLFDMRALEMSPHRMARGGYIMGELRETYGY